MLSSSQIETIGFTQLEASNGNKYYQKGESILIPFGIGWHFKVKSVNNVSYTYLESEQDLYLQLNLKNIVRTPIKEENIYPFTEENVNALFNRYLNLKKGNVTWLFELEDFSLNQLEFAVEKVSEFQYYLDAKFKGKSGCTISNYLHYSIDACYQINTISKPSKARIDIIVGLRNLIFNS